MCNRFAFAASPEDLQSMIEQLGLATGDRLEFEQIAPRYNIAPTQELLVFRNADAGEREMARLRWGLIPSWNRDPKPIPLFNARSETAAEKPSFRKAFERRRCIIPASGFFEWQHIGKKIKQPYFVSRAGGGLLPFAGLWERWQSPDGPVDTATILTVEANDLVRPLHDRMPAILSPEQFDHWLDQNAGPADQLLSLLQPYPAEQMKCWPIDQKINSVKAVGGAELTAPLEAGDAGPRSLF